MTENLYPQLPIVPPMSRGSFNIEWSENPTKTLRTLRKNILKSNGNTRMPTIDYYMHPQVQVLLL